MRFRAYILLSIYLILNIAVWAQAITGDDEQWARDIGYNARNMLWDDLQNQLANYEASIQENILSTQKKRVAGLYVFISTSMPKSLLKEYYEQSKKYGAVLVFKGLPSGSFKELYATIHEIVGSNELEEASFQIDDESFMHYGIDRVPSFVLVKDQQYSPNQDNKVIYDKLTGNVGIKYALEQFADKGELQSIALEYLK